MRRSACCHGIALLVAGTGGTLLPGCGGDESNVAKPTASGGSAGVSGAGGVTGGGSSAGGRTTGPPDDGGAAAPDAAPSAGGMGASGTGGNPSGAGGSGGARDGGDTVFDGGGPRDAGACTACAEYAAPRLVANISSSDLAEVSGIAASWRTPGAFFVHNDRARPDVYAIDRAGTVLAHYAVPGAEVSDVEDIGVGPCPTGTCVFLADIGGNLSPREQYAILRMPEPTAVDPPATLAFESYRFSYEDGRHNAEGLLVEPRTGRLYVVTKVADGQPSSVYALPPDPSATALNTAIKVVDLPVPASGGRAVSASSAHPCGAGFLLRTYDAVYEFRIAPSEPFESAFSASPVRVAEPSEPQSEGISYLSDGSGFVTTGETAAAPIYETRCR